MLKARSRKLSMLLVLAMLMTMFAGIGTASAAIVDYSAFGVTTVNTSSEFDKTLGSIMIEIDDAVYLGTYKNYVTLKMPSGVSLLTDATDTKTLKDGTIVAGPSVATTYGPGVDVIVKNSSTVDISIDPDIVTGSDIKIELTFKNVRVQSGSGNLDVMFISQGGSILPNGNVTIANIVSKGATQAMITSVKSLSEAGGAIDTISIGELSPGALETGTIKIELPAGVKWVQSSNMATISSAVASMVPGFTTELYGLVQGAWAYEGYNTNISGKDVLSPAAYTVTIDGDKEDVLLVDFVTLDGKGKAGRIDIAGLEIDIDEDDAKKGDIVAKISSAKNGKIDGLTKQDLVIAKYGDYETTLAENEVTELVAGQADQELGSFYIEESLKASLVAGRNITLTLPSGVKWNEEPVLTAEKGDINAEVELVSASKARIKIDSFSDNAGKILVEDGEVYVEPNFEGDVELEVTGTAGVRGTVKVAEVVKAVDISASEVPNIIIGEQNVPAGDIIIKENVAEAIQEKEIVIELAGGYVFYKEPTVTVTDGDLRIDDVDINNDDQLVITIDKESNDASTITISDVFVTGYRYAPTGPVVAKFVAAKGYKEIISGDEIDIKGSTAFDTFYLAPGKSQDKDNKYSEKSVGEVTIANCITPADGSGVIEFRVDSNVYYVGGNAKVMDVAPYIKGDRTYVPMRFLGEILGADVVWDDAARTVTLTKGDDVVVFTIGSTSYTVNGEALTADVAPEITNDRTMLPARFVAEAFGAVVGWDAGTRTVLIQQQ